MKNKVFKDFQYVVVYFTYVTEIMSRKRKTQQTNEAKFMREIFFTGSGADEIAIDCKIAD